MCKNKLHVKVGHEREQFTYQVHKLRKKQIIFQAKQIKALTG